MGWKNLDNTPSNLHQRTLLKAPPSLKYRIFVRVKEPIEPVDQIKETQKTEKVKIHIRNPILSTPMATDQAGQTPPVLLFFKTMHEQQVSPMTVRRSVTGTTPSPKRPLNVSCQHPRLTVLAQSDVTDSHEILRIAQHDEAFCIDISSAVFTGCEIIPYRKG